MARSGDTSNSHPQKSRSLLLCVLLLVMASPCFASDRIVLVAGGKQDELPAKSELAKLHEPFGIAFDGASNVWIVEMSAGNRLLVLKPDGMLSAVTENRTPGFAGDGANAKSVQMNGPHNLAVGPNGRVFIADTWNGRIRVWDPRALQMNSLLGFQVELEKAKKAGPYCVSITPGGDELLISDLVQVHRVHVSTGDRSIVAGNGEKGVPKDGSAAKDSPLVDPRAAVQDRLGNVYVLERNGNSLRVVSSDGKIRTVVNASGVKGITESTMPASNAMLNGPKHLCMDLQDRVLIADAENHIVVRYDPKTESVTPLAGTGKKGSQGVDGPPLLCQLNRPHGVCVHPTSGHILIVDTYNDRILRIEP